MLQKNIESKFEEFKKDALVTLKEKLENIEEFPYDFNSNALHDTINEELDAFVNPFNNQDCLKWIAFCNNENDIDQGLVDTSNVDKMLMTLAYSCINQKLFDDEKLFYDLQEYELTKTKRKQFLKRINEITKNKRHSKGINSASQIFIETNFCVSVSDFKEPYFNKDQIIDLHGGIKILTSPIEINKNALVIQELTEKSFRFYLMDKDKDIDIRNFFLYRTIKDADYNLDPKCYIQDFNKDQDDKNLKTNFTDKKRFIYTINQMINQLCDKGQKEKGVTVENSIS